jgi:hypothetical protein
MPQNRVSLTYGRAIDRTDRQTLRRVFSMIVVLMAHYLDAAANQQKKGDDSWTTNFAVEKSDLLPAGRNPYFILEPGYRLVLKGGNEQLVITVLDETKMVEGVSTRIVEERETKAGSLVEVLNSPAVSRRP